MKSLILSLLTVGLTLGTAWAVRGKFGHEQGAAWAGALGAMVIILLARREDWYNKFFKASLGAAIGWGLGGMMSYGLVVGYGKGTDFINVWYGLHMLFVIGGLYGFMGGGLMGLVLEESETKPIKWEILLSGMTASGVLGYFFMILQWEWLMTPPRSELWAACLGAAIFLAWYMKAKGFSAALQVAFFSGLGGGFGFAVGNFLNVLGMASSLSFNFWNVMEYSLGFFGGMGMAYGTYIGKWERDIIKGSPRSIDFIPIALLTAFIPLVIWDQSFTVEGLSSLYTSGGDLSLSRIVQVSVLGLLAFQTVFFLTQYTKNKTLPSAYSYQELQVAFFLFFMVYILLSFVKTGTPIYHHLPEQYLYLLNVGAIAFLLRASPTHKSIPSPTNKGRLLLITLGILTLLAFILIYSHGELPGTPIRFER